MDLKLFLSHNSKYVDLAHKLKLSLQSLERDEHHIDVRLSADMPGGTDWRKWIETNVRAADLFLLLYPHEGMDMGWCNYELGRFHATEKPAVCLMNTDIQRPPPAFQPDQAYRADEGGLFKMLREFFVEGRFSDHLALNPEVGNPASDFHARARDVCKVLAGQFAKARVREMFYDRRIVFSLSYGADGLVDLDRSTIQGNAEGLGLVGLSDASVASWATLRRTVSEHAEWLDELRAALPGMPTGALPPALPPFRAASGVHLPIIVRAAVTDGRIQELSVIFVSAGIERLRPMLGWTFPQAAPPDLAYLVQLVRHIFVARWEILEPRYQEAAFRQPTAERRAQLVQEVLAGYQRMQEDFERSGDAGLGRFYGAFQRGLRDEVNACSQEYQELTARLRELAQPQGGEPAATLKGLLVNNARWLSLIARQFDFAVGDLY
ncbi:hypothetical protein SNE35_13970 [Paucibacter sp. R3-3]|uniref:TIR domain-containing protein n=1 Tax=Roseateles agri TaxID=3098619 RepID=A0ABU5DIQ7_9BURK|nr:hypothetical protein [Paucibacter sp. R3-3]MDY0745623.1 hypothetical protein [Paucibacter sp. R3-3]